MDVMEVSLLSAHGTDTRKTRKLMKDDTRAYKLENEVERKGV